MSQSTTRKSMGRGNSSLQNAKRAKNDEFYTRLEDIEEELKHYKEHFKGKVVFCNCDDPYESNFFKYFATNFNVLGLKKLICTSYAGSPVAGKEVSLFYEEERECNIQAKRAYKVILSELKDVNNDGREDINDVKEIIKHRIRYLKGDGDFRSDESIELLKQADIVVTNPPFSLFREYIAQLIAYKKSFLIIGNMNAITYKEIFPLIKNNLLWLGYKSLNQDTYFNVTDEYKNFLLKNKKEGSAYKIVNGIVMGRLASACWFTNLDHKKRHEELLLFKKFAPEKYPKYDNYDAINVDKVVDIPCDYDGVMGVPITFLDKYNPDQFEIVAFRKGEDGKDLVFTRERERESSTVLSYPCATTIAGMIKNAEGKINGKITYARITRQRKGNLT